MQAVDVMMLDVLEAAEQALADLLRVLVVVARQVVGFRITFNALTSASDR